MKPSKKIEHITFLITVKNDCTIHQPMYRKQDTLMILQSTGNMETLHIIKLNAIFYR